MSGNALMEAAQPLCEAARVHSRETEAGRRLARPVVEAFEASGLGRALAPTSIGGFASDPRAVLETIEAVSMADASAGWCCGIGIGCNYLSSLVPETTASELFDDLRKGGAGPFGPGSLAMPGDEGVHVAGRWKYASNCQQAAVLVAGVVLCDASGPVVGPGGVALGLGFLRADDFTVDENWDLDGLRGTGSHDVLAEIDLDPARISSLWAEKWPDEPLFRLRTFDVLGPTLAMVPLAIGRRALDVLRVKTIGDTEPVPGPRTRLADDPVAHLRVAEAEVRLRSARTLLLDLVEQAIDQATTGNTPSRETSAMIGLACGESLRAGRDVVQIVSELLGSTGARENSPMLGLRRDTAAAGNHIMFSHNVQIGLGRELAGLPTAAFPFLPSIDT
jgi:alkylation response protein AidB-like acyl-CoA dehydrogenase